MKNHSLFLFPLFFVSFLAIGCSQKNSARHKEVVVYTYDSFSGEWGPGPEIARLFKEKTGLDVVYTDCGDGGQILSKALMEKDSPQADVLVGIDNNLADRARQAGILESYRPGSASGIIPEGFEDALGGDWFLTPYDYSHFAMIYDTESDVPAPESLEDLTKEVYRKKIILMDPRTSTPGLGFVAWTVAVFGDGYRDFWKRLKPSVLTMSPGWSAGYGLFTEGEAPLVISYTTSPAYHVEYGEGDRFKALVFEEGHVRQVEGAGILKNAQNRRGAEKFIDFLISAEAQSVIPLTQWMFPVNGAVTMPESYSIAAPLPTKTLYYSSAAVNDAVPVIMDILSK